MTRLGRFLAWCCIAAIALLAFFVSLLPDLENNPEDWP
jgi:hypothetical protein